MVASPRQKPLDKQEVCRKVTALLKKTYSGTAPKRELPVLETLLYAICLENATPAQADAVYARLLNAFHDLNEIRVSSITELLPVFVDVDDGNWRALRIKASLQHVFETNYSFDFESLKRKTLELAVKQLGKVPSLSAFVRSFVLQHCLGSHILPIDARMHAALVWLHLAEPGSTPEQAAEALRSHVRKADAEQFCHLIHCLATDPKRMRAFAAGHSKASAETEDPAARLARLLQRGDAAPPAAARGSKRPPAKPARKAPAKTSRPAARPAPRPAKGKTASKKKH
ncbi:MAG: hypothetical protein ACKV0T_19540 [Planctomycetales bacterium]